MYGERRSGVGWKTAKICITIADRNNYARNARAKRVEEYGRGCKCRRSGGDSGGDGGIYIEREREGLQRRGAGCMQNGNTARNADTRIRRRFVEAAKKTRGWHGVKKRGKT